MSLYVNHLHKIANIMYIVTIVKMHMAPCISVSKRTFSSFGVYHGIFFEKWNYPETLYLDPSLIYLLLYQQLPLLPTYNIHVHTLYSYCSIVYFSHILGYNYVVNAFFSAKGSSSWEIVYIFKHNMDHIKITYIVYHNTVFSGRTTYF